MKITKEEIIDAIADKYLKSVGKKMVAKKPVKRGAQSIALKKAWARRKRAAKKAVVEAEAVAA